MGSICISKSCFDFWGQTPLKAFTGSLSPFLKLKTTFRLKKGKSSVRLFAKQDKRGGCEVRHFNDHPPIRVTPDEEGDGESVTLRQIVRDVCSEEAVSDLAVVRTELHDKNEEVRHVAEYHLRGR